VDVVPAVAARLPRGWERLVAPEWLRDWRPAALALEDGLTEVVVLGTGPPLLLLPPLPGYKEAWLGVAARLAARFRVIAWDLRVRHRGRPSWDAHLRDLERVSDRLAREPAVVVGHSLGGALAQRWALARPDRVSALVLSSSFARVTTQPAHWGKRYLEQAAVLASQRLLPEPIAAALARRLAARGAWVYDPLCDERLLAFVRFCIRTQPLAAARDCVLLAFAHDTRAALPALRHPTLIVVGERESAWARGAADELRALVPRAEWRCSPGASHLHPLSAPAWLADTVLEWTAALAPDRSRTFGWQFRNRSG
jgi:pimeloyl-ACP methyl ester carboxylesterase